jgi:DNA-directed RNA polymerase alpha subunit
MSQFFISCKESRIESNRSFYSSFFIGPFDPGESLTIANALRRTLLSELGGIAIISVEIEGASHEYSNLPGVCDTVLDILLNIKDIVLKKLSKNMKPQLGYLRARGPGVVRASDLRLPPFIQCVDPDQYIATLAEDGNLNIKFIIDEGKNYIKGKPKTIIDFNQFKKRRLILKKLNQVCNNSSLLNNYYFYLNKKYKTKFELKNSKLSLDPRSNLFVDSDYIAIKQKTKKTPPSSLNLLNVDAVFNPINKVNYIIEANAHKIIESVFDKSNLIENTYQTINASLNSSLNLTNVNKDNLKLELNIEKMKPLLSIPAQSCLENLRNYQLNLVRLKNLSYKKKIDLVNSRFLLPEKENIIDLPPLGNENKKTKNLKEIYLKGVGKTKKTFKTKINLQNKKSDLFGRDELGSLSLRNYQQNLENISDIIDLKNQSTLDLINPRLNSKGFDVWIGDGKKDSFKNNIILEIWTNGSLHPREALYQAFKHLVKLFSKLKKLKILAKLFESDRNYKDLIRKIKNENFELLPLNENLFIGKYGGIKPQLNKTHIKYPKFKINKNLESQNLNQEKTFSLRQTSYNDFNLIDIGTLNISLRPYASLKRSNINTLADLLKKSKKELIKLPNFGKKSLEEIEKSLNELELELKLD